MSFAFYILFYVFYSFNFLLDLFLCVCFYLNVLSPVVLVKAAEGGLVDTETDWGERITAFRAIYSLKYTEPQRYSQHLSL